MANISPHIFQTFWWGDALSPYEMLCLKSFVDYGHQVHLYSYTTQLAVPEGVVVRDATALIAGDRFFAYESGAEKALRPRSPICFAIDSSPQEAGGGSIPTLSVCRTRFPLSIGSLSQIGFIGNVAGALKVEIVGHRHSIEKAALLRGIMGLLR